MVGLLSVSDAISSRLLSKQNEPVWSTDCLSHISGQEVRAVGSIAARSGDKVRILIDAGDVEALVGEQASVAAFPAGNIGSRPQRLKARDLTDERHLGRRSLRGEQPSYGIPVLLAVEGRVPGGHTLRMG
jgi:hypothetical protein